MNATTDTQRTTDESREERTPPGEEQGDEALALAEFDVSDPSGYGTHDEYFAMRFPQGGRVLYSVDLSVPQLVATLPKPDPEHRQPGNRKINLAHARAFGEYVRERPDWVCPSLLLRAPEGEFEFRSIKMVGGTELGILSIPRLARTALQILDGQHRILGFHLVWQALADEVQSVREAITVARRNGPPEFVREHERKLERSLGIRDRLSRARVSLDIMIVDDPDAYKQVFVDIADNAKGVTRSLNARFDRRKVVHRALPLVMEHPLLETRVEEESDRLSATNPNLFSAKHVADITRTVEVGAARRISRRLEDELEERRVAEHAARFLDVMVEAFPDLEAVMEGKKAPGELRRESLLGSGTMIRIFAGAYHELVLAEREDPTQRMTDSEVTGYFRKFAAHMEIPVDDEWRATGLFKESGNAPEASQGDVKKLADRIVDWSKENGTWSKEGGEPRPSWLA